MNVTSDFFEPNSMENAPRIAIGMGSGAKNAALLAIQILALTDKKVAEKLRPFKDDQLGKVVDANQKVQGWLAERG